MTDTQMTDEQMVEELEAEQSMFVQTARAVTADGTTLTLKDVTPSTLYFSDRPKRIVGHMTTVDFVDLWAEGDNNFEEDPPNAVLSFLESADQAPEDAVVVLRQPHLENGELSYSIETLEHRSHADGARHTVHRPVRTAALARICMRGETARAATRPQTVGTRAPATTAQLQLSQNASTLGVGSSAEA
ncbi:MAG: hypothetical protein WB761_07460 [Solirubrobacteraceae bacterium]